MPGYAGVAAVLALCVIATGAIWLFRTGGGKSQQHASQLAISPDGATVAFVWNQGNGASPQIATLANNESSPRPLTKATGKPSSPAWSPDGKSLAYVRVNDDKGELVVAHRDGSDERTIPGVFPMAADLPYRVLDWSPDGHTLAVAHTMSNGEPIGIFLVTLATGDTKQLTRPAAAAIGDVEPRFSPDGKSIGFVRAFDRARQESFVADIAAATTRQITSDNKQVSGYDWGPASNSLLFASNRTGEFCLWTVRVNSNEVRRFASIQSESPIELSIARNAPALVYSVPQQDFDIWRLDLRSDTPAPQRWKTDSSVSRAR
jgi:Tol biopolymer transport system component